MKKTILLTGASGFLGSHLVPELVKNNYRVACMLRPQEGVSTTERLRKALETACHGKEDLSDIMPHVDVVEGDVAVENFGLDKKKLNALSSEVDNILHCAALTSFSPNIVSEQWKINVDGTENLMQFAHKCKSVKEFHYVSTAYVAGDRKDLVYEQELDKGQGFFNGYEKSKFHAEKLLNKYREKTELKITIYRPSIIVGDSESGRTILFNGIYLFMRFFQVAKLSVQTAHHEDRVELPIRMLGDPEVTKNFVHIDYVVKLIATLFSMPEALGKTFHITHDNPPKQKLIIEVAEDILNMSGIQMVNGDSFKNTPPNELESLLQEEIGVYAPYLMSEPSFDKSMVKAVLPVENAPPCPPMEQQALEKLFSYAIKSKWGKRKNV